LLRISAAAVVLVATIAFFVFSPRQHGTDVPEVAPGLTVTTSLDETTVANPAADRKYERQRRQAEVHAADVSGRLLEALLLRRGLGDVYELVAPKVLGGTSREEWAAGRHLPLPARPDAQPAGHVVAFSGPRSAGIVSAYSAPSVAQDYLYAVRVEEVDGHCWSLRQDDALGSRLLELGFQDGWQPHWMGLDPARASAEPSHEVEETARCARALPYGSEWHESLFDDDVHHFVVRHDGTVAGHVVIDLDGAIGGIYDMGVLESARRRGLGRALVLAALARARDAGCVSVTLNATSEGESLYRSVGFESLWLGMTWWLFPQPEEPIHLWRRTCVPGP
jgi:GNAT superfamily N-acetyltransferase